MDLAVRVYVYEVDGLKFDPSHSGKLSSRWDIEDLEKEGGGRVRKVPVRYLLESSDIACGERRENLRYR